VLASDASSAIGAVLAAGATSATGAVLDGCGTDGGDLGAGLALFIFLSSDRFLEDFVDPGFLGEVSTLRFTEPLPLEYPGLRRRWRSLEREPLLSRPLILCVQGLSLLVRTL